MIIYHTVRLTDLGRKKTVVFDIETKQTTPRQEDIYEVIDDFNKNGYYLTAVDKNHFYLTKRVD